MCLAVPGKVLTAAGDDPLDRTGRVSFGGVVREVSLALVPDAAAGDYVVVHAGFALNRLDEAEAARVFDHLRRIGELAELAEPGGGADEVRG
jgi:hydrogenase expression/formation protein HypC